MTVNICGVARSGKDSVTKIFIDFFAQNGICAKRYAFADELKKQLFPLLGLNFGISSFTEDAKEKPLIRPLLLAYGQMARNIDPDYWVKVVDKSVKNKEVPHVAIVSDCRYINEYNFFSGPKKLIHIAREKEDGTLFPPVGSDEEKNDPILQQFAEKNLIWKDFQDNLEKLVNIGEAWFYEIFGPQLNDLREKYPI